MLKRLADTEAVEWLFITCLIGTLVAAEHYGWTDQVRYFSTLAFAITGWLSAGILRKEVYRLIKGGNGKFEQIRWKFLSQSMVDERLRAFAATFDELCQTQVRLRRDVDDGDNQELVNLRMMLDASKAGFWTAHQLARELGFEVKPKVGDYLV